MGKSTRSNSKSDESHQSSEMCDSADVMKELRNISGKIDSINTKLNDTNSTITTIEARQAVIEGSLLNVQQAVQNIGILENRIEDMEQNVKQLEDKTRDNYEANRMRIDNLEVTLKRNNLVIRGLADKEIDDRSELAKKVNDIFSTQLKSSILATPSQVFRLGPFTIGKTRHIIFRATTYDDKMNLLKNNTSLKGSKIYIEHDYTASQQLARFQLRSFARTKMPEKYKWVKTNVIIIGAQKFKYDFFSQKIVSVP